MYDGGDAPVPRTNLKTVAAAIVGILSKPAETKNRVLVISDSCFTQSEILSELEKATQAKWAATHVTARERLEWGMQGLKMGGEHLLLFIDCIQAKGSPQIFRDEIYSRVSFLYAALQSSSTR